jgi:hypothetical protein
MSVTTRQRAMAPAERVELEQISKGGASSPRWKRALENALVLWSALMLAFVIGWALVGWFVRKVFALDVGWQSPQAPWILLAGIVGSLVCSIGSTITWMRGWKDYRPLVSADLAGEVVLEEHLEFADVKRFQEAEHGGLMYFFKTTDDRVFVLYDHESQDLGVDGQDPLGSPFRPCSRLALVRAPSTRYVLSQSFSGAELAVQNTIEIVVPPKQWPESEEFCDIPWDELESRLGSGKRTGVR